MESTTKENAPLAGEAKAKILTEIRDQYKGESRVDQRSRLLSALSVCPVSTFEARRYLDVMHPAGRVMELRRGGWDIDTFWITQKTQFGRPHRIAIYAYKACADE